MLVKPNKIHKGFFVAVPFNWTVQHCRSTAIYSRFPGLLQTYSKASLLPDTVILLMPESAGLSEIDQCKTLISASCLSKFYETSPYGTEGIKSNQILSKHFFLQQSEHVV